VCTVALRQRRQGRHQVRIPGGWDSTHSGGSKLEQVNQCKDLSIQHCIHWLHMEPTHQQASAHWKIQGDHARRKAKLKY
jgi:uncharacterized protein YbdZ (MbtH family)